MSVCVYPLPPDQQVSPGAKVALRALEPFNAPKLWRAPWDLNRNPLTFAALTRLAWRPDMELPEDIAALAGEFAPGPSTTTTRRTTAGGGGACLESMSWAFNIVTQSGGVPTWDCVSTPAVPWPFIIGGFTVSISPLGAVAAAAIVQLYLTDAEYTTLPITTPETRLLFALGNSGAQIDELGLKIHANDTSAQQLHATLASSVIGTLVPDPGKRVTIAALMDNGSNQTVSGHLTLQRCDAPAQFSSTSLRTTTRPPAVAMPGAPAAAAPAPAAAAPAPAPQYVSTGTCLKAVTSGGFPLEFWRQRGYTLPLCGGPEAIRDAGPADNPAAATYWAQIMEARGDATRAAMFRDMANRMLRGYSLTPTQLTYLSSPTAYQATGRSLGVTPVSQPAPLTGGLVWNIPR